MRESLKNTTIILLIILLFFSAKSYGEEIEPKYIDVKLTMPIVDDYMVNLESPLGFSIFYLNEKDNPLLLLDEPKITAIINGDGFIELYGTDGDSLFTLPSDGSLIIGSNDLEDPTIKVEKDRYRDFIRILTSNNKLVVLNHVELEHYLYGVVPREMSYTSPFEALKAQAVASRSYSMSNVNKHQGEGYNLCDTTHCQVYGGYEFERQETNLAVEETRGIYIYYDNEIIEAFYHSSSSGYTEDSSNVWGGTIPYLTSVKDIYSLASPYSNWKISISLSELNAKLVQNGVYIGDLKGVEIIETNSTGKVNKVKLTGSLGEEILSDSNFRNILGNTTLKSNWFNIVSGGTNSAEKKAYVLDGSSILPRHIDIANAFIIDGTQYKKANRGTVNRAIGKDRSENIGTLYQSEMTDIVIEGRGYGHGVGMSQFGAMRMAEEGFSFEEILKFYYTGVEVF
ncbi:MAG: SpoIID/LytB domain-containing protein [Tissierellaceae bacterium]|nr:SpoIID/LytB domain-containing protein [Tissierellaceae bacterium]